MIIKFCFQGEIHRTSEAPQELSALPSFLSKMFSTTKLPQHYTLCCSTPDGLDITLNSQEDYQLLQNQNYKKPFKIYIMAQPEISIKSVPEDVRLEEVNIEFETSQNKLFSGTSDIEEKMSNLDIQECLSIAQDGLYVSYYKMPEETIDDGAQNETNRALLTETSSSNHNDKINSILFSKEQEQPQDNQINSPFYYEAPTQGGTSQYYHPMQDIEQECLQKAQQVNKAFNETEIRNIVRETMEQQMPIMYAQFKQALINEGLINRPQPQYHPPSSPYYHIPQQPQYYQARHIPPRHYPQQQPQYYQVPNGSTRQENSQNNPDLFGKVFNVLSDLPGRAVQMVDSFAQILEGDPYISCEEGKYPKSVVEKSIHMRQVFPEASKKDMLEFVQRFPKDTSLDQLIQFWSFQKQQKQSN